MSQQRVRHSSAAGIDTNEPASKEPKRLGVPSVQSAVRKVSGTANHMHLPFGFITLSISWTLILFAKFLSTLSFSQVPATVSGAGRTGAATAGTAAVTGLPARGTTRFVTPSAADFDSDEIAPLKKVGKGTTDRKAGTAPGSGTSCFALALQHTCVIVGAFVCCGCAHFIPQ
jgi:hypothetical protein